MLTLDRLLTFEHGELTEGQTITLFQEMVDTGLAWVLQGPYGMVAAQMIDAGVLTDGPTVREIENDHDVTEGTVIEIEETD